MYTSRTSDIRITTETLERVLAGLLAGASFCTVLAQEAAKDRGQASYLEDWCTDMISAGLAQVVNRRAATLAAEEALRMSLDARVRP